MSSPSIVVLAEFVRKRRRVEALRDVLLLDFEPDPDSAVRKCELLTAAAQRLGKSVSNALALDAREALAMIGARSITRNGHGFYLGVRARST